MSDYQKAQYNQSRSSIKIENKYIDIRANHIQHIKNLSNKFDNQPLKLKNSTYKRIKLPLQVFKKKYRKPLRKTIKNPYMQIDYHMKALLSARKNKKL